MSEGKGQEEYYVSFPPVTVGSLRPPCKLRIKTTASDSNDACDRALSQDKLHLGTSLPPLPTRTHTAENPALDATIKIGK
jgi:hypothetical protein